MKILFHDIYHQQISEGNLILNIRKYYDEIGYFQFGDHPGRHEPFTGEIYYPNVFRAFRNWDSKGMIGGEYSPAGVAATRQPRSLDAVKRSDVFYRASEK
ncbi:MAG: hypothetical protein U1D30_00205 [Planctomycetota bacterium]